jgi:hypothetical protein
MEFAEDLETFGFPEAKTTTVSGNLAMTLYAEHIH